MIRRSTSNADEEERLAELIREAKEEALQPGWFGEVVVRLQIQDGVIQRSSGVECIRRRR